MLERRRRACYSQRMVSQQSIGEQWLTSLLATLLFAIGPVRHFCAPPLIILRAICWWVQEVRLLLAPRRRRRPVRYTSSPSAIPYGLYPLSCILLE